MEHEPLDKLVETTLAARVTKRL